MYSVKVAPNYERSASVARQSQSKTDVHIMFVVFVKICDEKEVLASSPTLFVISSISLA